MDTTDMPRSVRVRAATRAFLLVIAGLLLMLPCMTLYSYLQVRWSPYGRTIKGAVGKDVAFLSRATPVTSAKVFTGPLEDLALDWEPLKGFCWRFSVKNQTGGGQFTLTAGNLDDLQIVGVPGLGSTRWIWAYIFLVGPIGTFISFVTFNYCLQRERLRMVRHSAF